MLTASLHRMVPEPPLPLLTMAADAPRFELVGWSRAYGSPRELDGYTGTSEDTWPGHAYRLTFRDRQTGRVFAGAMAHGMYAMARERDAAAQRHYRAGILDEAAELGFRSERGVSR